MKTKIEPSRILVNFLRANITDINSGRSGQWIVDHLVRYDNLGDAEFPRISITPLTESSEPLGMFDDNQWETITFQIDVVIKADQKLNVTETDEALGTMSLTVNSDRFTFNHVPNSVTNIKHNGTAFGTVTAKNTDSVFTAPASLAAGTVEYSLSTGNLNFSSADVASYDGQAITSTYVIVLEGRKQGRYLAREIVKSIRTNWRTDATIKGLMYPLKISNNAIVFEEEFGFFRQMLEYQFRAFNAGEGL